MGSRLSVGQKSKGRESAIEILRILSILMIILHHFAVHGKFDFENDQLNEFFVQIFSIGGKLGVNIFVLISGYFLVKSKFKVKKVVLLVFQVLFWSVTVMAVIYGFGFAEPDPNVIFKSFFPITYKMYWFASAYVVLYLLSPFLNIFINSASKKQLRALIVLLFVLWSILGTVMNSSLEINDLGWFIFLYFVAAYIRLYPNKQTEKKASNFSLFGVCIALEIFLMWIYHTFGFQLSFCYEETKKYKCLIKQEYLLIFLAAVFIFLGFKNLKIGSIKIVNVISSATFGVYLIHDNPVLRPVLWQDILKTQNYSNSLRLAPYAVCIVLLIYVCCTVLELLRKKLIEKPFSKLYDVIEAAIKKKKECFITKKD